MRQSCFAYWNNARWCTKLHRNRASLSSFSHAQAASYSQGTGLTLVMRFDASLRALQAPGFRWLQGSAHAILACSLRFKASPTLTAGAAKVPRKGITREERLYAQLLHRSHLVCLLARGLAHDAASSNEALQAMLLSLLDPQLLDQAAAAAGGAADSMETLRVLLEWFVAQFRANPLSKGTTVCTTCSVLMCRGPARMTACAFVLLFLVVAMFS